MSEIQSPCIRNCCLDNDDICMGCFRHITEITQWASASQKLKIHFLSNALSRKNAQDLKIIKEFPSIESN